MTVMNASTSTRDAAPVKRKRKAPAKRSKTAETVAVEARNRATAKKTQSVSPPTNGEEATQQADLDTAVKEINVLAKEGHYGDIQIGRLLFENVFGGDRANLGSKRRNPSWRELAKRNDVELSHSRLWKCLHLHLQNEDLRKDGVDPTTLRVSHQRLLTSVKDKVVKAKLARQAAAKSWTVTQLEAAIRETRGKPQVAEHVKALKALPKIIDALADARVKASDVKALGGTKRVAQIRESLERQLKMLPALLESLDAALADPKK